MKKYLSAFVEKQQERFQQKQYVTQYDYIKVQKTEKHFYFLSSGI